MHQKIVKNVLLGKRRHHPSPPLHPWFKEAMPVERRADEPPSPQEKEPFITMLLSLCNALCLFGFFFAENFHESGIFFFKRQQKWTPEMQNTEP